MKELKFTIKKLIYAGGVITLCSCSNSLECSDNMPDKLFHEEVVKLQNEYNSSLKINESILNKNDETLANISEILRVIENSCFDYELVPSEDGGLAAMPILTTTSTRSNSTEVDPLTHSEILSHPSLPCKIKVTCSRQKFSITSQDQLFILTNESCRGSVTEDYVDISGRFKIRRVDQTTFSTYSITRRISSYENIFQITEII